MVVKHPQTKTMDRKYSCQVKAPESIHQFSLGILFFNYLSRESLEKIVAPVVIRKGVKGINNPAPDAPLEFLGCSFCKGYNKNFLYAEISFSQKLEIYIRYSVRFAGSGACLNKIQPFQRYSEGIKVIHRFFLGFLDLPFIMGVKISFAIRAKASSRGSILPKQIL